MRPTHHFLRSSAIAAVAILGPESLVWSASTGVESIQGAWAQQGLSCQEVFTTTRRGTSFRQPARLFDDAFIIKGRRLRTPGASCSIQSISAVGDRLRLSLSCATSVAVDPVKAQLSPGQDGSLIRYGGDSDPVGNKYIRCDRQP